MAMVAKLIQRHLPHLPHLLTHLRHRRTMAALEGVNAAIQWVNDPMGQEDSPRLPQRRALQDGHLLHCGGLDLYPHDSR